MPTSEYIPVDTKNKPIPLSFPAIFFGGGPLLTPRDNLGKIALVKHKKNGEYDVGRSKKENKGRPRKRGGGEEIRDAESPEPATPQPLTEANLAKAASVASAPAPAPALPATVGSAVKSPSPRKPPTATTGMARKPPTATTPMATTILAATPSSSEFTALEDSAIIGMKARSFTWQEMAKMLPGKDVDAIQKRYYEMVNDTVVVETNAGEGPSKLQKKKGKQLKGVLKKTGAPATVEDADSDEGEIGEAGGRDVIRVDVADGLGQDDYAQLTELARKGDRAKWTEISSRFFDKTGRRLPESTLRHSLKNIRGV